MLQPTFSPTVLLFDDDPAILQMARRRFYDQTSLGVITVGNMTDAKRYLADPDIKFSAIVADLSVERGKDDPEDQLNDGIDLLALAKRQRPNIPQFVLSVWADQDAYRKRAQLHELDVQDWFQKLAFGAVDEADRLAPWHKVERYLYRHRLGDVADEEISDVIRERLRPPIRTYLQDLGPDYNVVLPIEVICRYEDDQWIADPMHLGMFQSGLGDSKEEALDELATAIVDQFTTLHGSPTEGLDPVSIRIFEGFKKHISIVTN